MSRLVSAALSARPAPAGRSRPRRPCAIPAPGAAPPQPRQRLFDQRVQRRRVIERPPVAGDVAAGEKMLRRAPRDRRRGGLHRQRVGGIALDRRSLRPHKSGPTAQPQISSGAISEPAIPQTPAKSADELLGKYLLRRWTMCAHTIHRRYCRGSLGGLIRGITTQFVNLCALKRPG